jgi:hypothetical protein
MTVGMHYMSIRYFHNCRTLSIGYRSYLSQQYGFHCTCAVCSLPDAESKASDKRLSEISQLQERLATWGQHRLNGIEAIRVVRQIWDLGEEEGYWSERGPLAGDAAWVAAAHQEYV